MGICVNLFSVNEEYLNDKAFGQNIYMVIVHYLSDIVRSQYNQINDINKV